MGKIERPLTVELRLWVAQELVCEGSILPHSTSEFP
jgi:hypothetical protein